MSDFEEYFDIQDHVVVTNPTSEKFIWQVGGEREYSLDPGQVKRLHGSSARLFVKKMTDLIIIQSNRVTELHSDEYRREISKQLIISVVKDNEDVEVEPVDLAQVARENDESPIKAEKEAAFPELKKETKPKAAAPKPKKAVASAKPTKKVEPKAQAKN